MPQRLQNEHVHTKLTEKHAHTNTQKGMCIYIITHTHTHTQALSVGIFPYVLKLLLSPDESIRPMLTFIWCKILVVDKSCQSEIIKEKGERYFVDMIANLNTPV